MNAVIDIILLPPAAAALILSLFFALEVTAAFAPPRRVRAELTPLRVAVVIPAHNEEAGVAATIGDARAQLRSGDRVIVVADNCADRTAEVARAAGALVVARNEPARRGKGYALQFGVDALRSDPPDVVCFFDADCRIEAGAVPKISAAAGQSLRPAQSMYVMRAPPGSGPSRAASAFAWLMMNRVRMSGLYRLFDITRLTGSGMAFPWTIAASLPFATGEIVEDLALTIAAAKTGAPPILVRGALTVSTLPASEAGARSQRARWELGSLRLARRASLPLLGRAFVKRDPRLAALALDVAIPPLSIFAASLAVLVSLCALGVAAGALWAPATAAAALVVFVLAVISAWLGFGRGVLPASQLGGGLAYLVGKARIYGKEGRASAKTWTRTARDRPGDAP